MRIVIPSALRNYAELPEVEVEGATVGEALWALDRKYPGIRFRVIDEQDRVRRHIRFFLNGSQVWDPQMAVSESDELIIVLALSGG